MAMSRVDVPLKPFSKNNLVAVRKIAFRVLANCSARFISFPFLNCLVPYHYVFTNN
ncbi:hypothetical protein LAF_1524 [Limosilactobacillus fermentum IFO 3956]|nr:hypothetical protein LAF_1524 [Limosilactobacillus fermentum IFO 3956]